MNSVPFYSQMVNWNGEDSGFPNAAEVEKWESNCCGIACARMVIERCAGIQVGYWKLLQRGLQRNAYNDVGWIHKGLVELAAEYGVKGAAHRGQSVDDLYRAVRSGSVCIASVSAGFRGGLKKKDSDAVFGKGGHLVVVFQNEAGEVSCNHPSSVAEWNKADWVVPDEFWRRSFSGGFMEFRP